MSTLNRNATGLLFADKFATLDVWTASPGFSVDATRPIYLTYSSPIPLLVPSPGPDAQGCREINVIKRLDGVWHANYDAADLANHPWELHYATSTDRGKTFTKRGKLLGPVHGSFASYCSATASTYKFGDKYFLPILVSTTAPGGIPSGDYSGQMYSAPDIAGPWTYECDGAPLGATGACDRQAHVATSIIELDGIFYIHTTTRTGPTTGTAWTSCIDITTDLSLQPTKDGLGPSASAVINNPTTGVRLENPQAVIVSAGPLLGWLMATSNAVDTAGQYTNTNQFLLAPPGCYDWRGTNAIRVHGQGLNNIDAKNAIGSPSLLRDPAGDVLFDADGRVPLFYDADPNVAKGHLCRRGRQAIAEPFGTAAKLANGATLQYLAKAIDHSDFRAEWELDFTANTVWGFGFRRNSAVGDSGSGYLIQGVTSTGRVQLQKLVNGVWKLLKEFAVGGGLASPNAWNLIPHKCELRVVGPNIQFLIDSFPMLNVNDADYASGTAIQIRAQGGPTYFRNFQMYRSGGVSMSGLPAGAVVNLRAGMHGVLFATGSADSVGNLTLPNCHWPMDIIDIEGVGDFLPEGGIYGGDAFRYSD